MNMGLVLVPVPVSDIDRAKDFYVDKVGFSVKTDQQVSDSRRVVQLTPPGSACSIVFGTGMPKIEMPTGTETPGLCSTEAREELAKYEIDVRGLACIRREQRATVAFKPLQNRAGESHGQTECLEGVDTEDVSWFLVAAVAANRHRAGCVAVVDLSRLTNLDAELGLAPRGPDAEQPRRGNHPMVAGPHAIKRKPSAVAALAMAIDIRARMPISFFIGTSITLGSIAMLRIDPNKDIVSTGVRRA